VLKSCGRQQCYPTRIHRELAGAWTDVLLRTPDCASLGLYHQVPLHDKEKWYFTGLPSDAGAAVDGVAFSFASRSRRGPCRSEQWEIIAQMNLDGKAIEDNTQSIVLDSSDHVCPAISTDADMGGARSAPAFRRPCRASWQDLSCF
jgi:hypothetical protein